MDAPEPARSHDAEVNYWPLNHNDDLPRMLVCKHVCYSGRVQGVGFRWTARRLAGGYSVSGSVRNLSDGNVELVAEGESDQVEAFLAAVANRMEGCIERETRREMTPSGLQGFEIRS